MDEKTIVDNINKGIDDFNDKCMTMGVDSKAYHITNIEIEGMDDKYLIQELKDEIKQLKCQLEVEKLVNELDGMDTREIANHIVYELGLHRNFN
jgi:hypothetical protein